MSLFTSGKRDLTGVAARLESWLRNIDPALGDARIISFKGANESAGQSNETYALTIEARGAERGIREFILRTSPSPDKAFFPTCSVEKQFKVMSALSRYTDIPVANCMHYERDTALFNAPFFLMDRIEGQVPADAPRYNTDGFVAEASAQERRRMWDQTLRRIAEIGQVDWRGIGLDSLDWPDRSRSRIDQHLDYVDAYYDWAIVGGEDAFPHVGRIRRWLRAHAPRDEAVGLLWGDARFGNVMFRNFEPVGIFDWELAQIGDPTADLAYFLMVDNLFHAANVVAGFPAAPRQEGFPDHASACAAFEAAIGRPVEHFAFYSVFNGYKMVSIQQRVARLMFRAGMLDHDAFLQVQQAPAITEWIDNAMRRAV